MAMARDSIDNALNASDSINGSVDVPIHAELEKSLATDIKDQVAAIDSTRNESATDGAFGSLPFSFPVWSCPLSAW